MGVKERKEKEKEIRVNDIVDAAERVFSSKGYDNSTMDDIAREADFSKRTVYIYVNSKEQLYQMILFRAFRTLNHQIEEAFLDHSGMTALEQIRLLGDVFYKFYAEYPLYFKTITFYENQENDFQSQDETIRQCYLEGEKSMDYLKETLKRGIEDGLINPEINITVTALVLWSHIIGVMNLIDKKTKYIEEYHKCGVEELIETSYDLIMKALKSER